MPRFDLRQDQDTLKPLASFQVLTVMCCPTDRIRRERMMGDIEATSGAAVPRRRPFSSEEFRSEVRLSSLRGVVAGGLLLTRLQLYLNGHRFSLDRAMPLVRWLLPVWELRYGGFPGHETQAPVSGLTAGAKCSTPMMSSGRLHICGRLCFTVVSMSGETSGPARLRHFRSCCPTPSLFCDWRLLCPRREESNALPSPLRRYGRS
jgi:hypothetical protein